MDAFNPVNTGASIFQARVAATDRHLTAVQSTLQAKTDADTDLQEACEQFESLMLNFMIREMRATVPEGTLLPRSMAEEIFTGMLDEKVADEMAQNGGIGISRMIFDQLRSAK